MSDRVRFAVSATPIETITDENSVSHDILASEVLHTLGGSGDSLSLTAYNGNAANQGYLNATVNYKAASYTGGGTELTVTEGDFLFIKNTGHVFSSTSVLGAVSTDAVIVAIRTGAQSDGVNVGFQDSGGTPLTFYFEVAWLQPGQAIVLPLGCKNQGITQFGGTALDLANLGSSSVNGAASIMVKTVSETTSNAVEYLMVT